MVRRRKGTIRSKPRWTEDKAWRTMVADAGNEALARRMFIKAGVDPDEIDVVAERVRKRAIADRVHAALFGKEVAR
jgi:hypothetical protein